MEPEAKRLGSIFRNRDVQSQVPLIILGLLLLTIPAFAKELYVPGEILVKFKPGRISAASVDDLKSQFGVQTSEKVFTQTKTSIRALAQGLPDLSLLYRITYASTRDAKAVAGAFSADPNVEFAEPNYYVYASATPDDPFYATQQWHLDNIKAPAAWDLNQGSTGVVIGIVDSGIDLDHPDLAANLWTNSDEIPNNGVDDDSNGYIDDYYGWDFVSNDKTPEPVPGGGDNDGVNHGTHVAGIASAVTNNGVGVAGVGWKCKVMAVKILSSSGSGTTSRALSGIQYAVDNGAQIINCSFGGGYSSSYDTIIDYIHGLGGLVVAAAGNDNIDIDADPQSPICNDRSDNRVLGVASSDQNDMKSGFSNYGATYVDVSAPGSAIYSTFFNDGQIGFSTDYGYESGTSMSTPLVCGTAALLKSYNSSLTPAQMIEIIRNTSDDPGLGPSMGKGRINARAALAAGAPAPTAPAINITGTPLSGPSPFNPASGGNLYFSYQLTADAAITLQVFDLNGGLVFTKNYPSGAAGGLSGSNTVGWNGRDAFDNLIPNGVYFYRIMNGTRILGRGKLAVLK
ncbi:S8 family serine peptidase [Candidatus Saganbacteria bacterium]|nr:S8 family serine peptidase [Candidatus Saganbacteria bacterium]